MIEYRDTRDLAPGDLEELFLSVEWASGRYPDRLAAAMKNYETVWTAWDGGRLVGLVCALDDGVMTAYAHFLLVRPEYQGRGVGRRLMELMMDKYRDYLRVVLCGVNEKVGFYERLGFVVSEDSRAMFRTELEN